MSFCTYTQSFLNKYVHHVLFYLPFKLVVCVASSKQRSASRAAQRSASRAALLCERKQSGAAL